MLAEITKRLPDYSSAVITGVNEQGFPSSVRCIPQPDAIAQLLHIPIPPGSDIQPGAASLLCHKHDEQFWNQHSFVVWGRLEREADCWSFYPERFTPGAATDLVSFARFLYSARRSARRYLAKRHLPRPRVPWNEIKALWAEVKDIKKPEW